MTSLGSGDPTTVDTPAYDHAPTTVVMRIGEGGGFVPYEYGFQQVAPRAIVLGDGRLVVTDVPGTEAWLGAREQQLDDAEMRRLLAAARDARLLEAPPDYGTPQVTDMGTTTVELAVASGTYAHSAYGLGMDDGLPERQLAARKRLRGFVELLTAAPRRTQGSQYVADRIAVLAAPSSVAGHGRRWTGPALPAQCTVLAGDDAAGAVALLRTARIDQDWRVAGETVHIVARPLLPGDAGCAA